MDKGKTLEERIEVQKAKKSNYVEAMKMAGLIQNSLDPRVDGFITILATLETE